MNSDDWVKVRHDLEAMLKKINQSAPNWGDSKNGQSPLRQDLRTRITRLLFYTEGIIDGRTDYYKH